MKWWEFTWGRSKDTGDGRFDYHNDFSSDCSNVNEQAHRMLDPAELAEPEVRVIDRPMLLPDTRIEILKAGVIQLPDPITALREPQPGGDGDLLMFVRVRVTVSGGVPVIKRCYEQPPSQRASGGLSLGNVSISLGKDGGCWVHLAVPYKFSPECEEMVALVNTCRAEFEPALIEILAATLRELKSSRTDGTEPS